MRTKNAILSYRGGDDEWEQHCWVFGTGGLYQAREVSTGWVYSTGRLKLSSAHASLHELPRDGLGVGGGLRRPALT